MANEADTCRTLVLPKLYAAGWADEQINEQRSFTDGRILVTGKRVRRKEQKRADYLLRYRRDFMIAVVEAKASYRTPGDGLQQAKDYAEILGLKFAYSTNGHGIIEFDFATGRETEMDAFPAPDDLWRRYRDADRIRDDGVAEGLLTPYDHRSGKMPRYYQEIAINRTVQSILKGKRRCLLTMATGTGKTFVAFQTCWKLWAARWNRTGEKRRPRVLYLSDRNILVDDPRNKDFAPFGDARHKIAHGEVVKSREMYFAIYQAIAKDQSRPGLYKEFAPGFFDLIVVDECHRGSAQDDSNWREILEYFEPAYQIGMTATPLREENRDTYAYFGNPIFTYSLRQGIDDGFLAPYVVHRVITTWDAAGWRPSQGDIDRYGRDIPDGEYQTKDFERVIALRARTEVVAKHLTTFLKKSGNRFAKTIVFCVDQEHADEMRRALNNLNSDLVQQCSDYVCRVTANEGDIGLGHLSHFQDVESLTPAILTTSKLLTTGVDMPTVRNVAIVRVVGSMTEFKQIIGRGTRVRDDYDKLYFNILDYTGSATRHFADPEFDGEPELLDEEQLDENGDPIHPPVETEPPDDGGDDGGEGPGGGGGPIPEPPEERRKYYWDGGRCEVGVEMVYELDPNTGKQLRVVKYDDYAGETVRTLYPSAVALRQLWADPAQRENAIGLLDGRGIDFDHLAEVTGQPDADPFDLLCHVAYNAPLRTRRERAERLRRDKKDFFDQFGPEAKAILVELLEKYAEHGTAQFSVPDVLEIPPISTHGNVMEIVEKFGGVEKLRDAVGELQRLLYAA